MSPRLLFIVGMSLLCACAGTPAPRESRSPDPGAAPAAQTQPAATEEVLDTPRALEMKTTAYARSFEGQVEARPSRNVSASVRPVGTSVTPPALPGSEIKWLEPREFRLAPPQDLAGAHPDPVSHTSAAAAAAALPVHNPPAGGTAEAAPRRELVVSALPPTQISALATPAIAPNSDQLELQLSRQVKDYPRDLATQLDLQLLNLLRGRPAPQMELIASLPAEDREILAALLDALSNFRSTARAEQNPELTRKVRPLVELSDRLRARAQLNVPTVALCQRVTGYGAYTPLEADRLIAGREYDTVIYCEVEDFSAKLNERNLWETNLSQEAVLYNERGQRIWEGKRSPVNDEARRRRRDFYILRPIRIPAGLPAGQYQLRITIIDQQANRVAEGSLPIRLVSAASSPATGAR